MAKGQIPSTKRGAQEESGAEVPTGVQSMRIEGSVRANLNAAIVGAKRWRGRRVHKDTVDHWRQLLDYGRMVDRESTGEGVSDLLAALEAAMIHIRAA